MFALKAKRLAIICLTFVTLSIAALSFAAVAFLAWLIVRPPEDRTLYAITSSDHDTELPAVHSAVWNRRQRELKRLLTSGADPDHVHAGVLAETPLHLAAVLDRRRAARTLIQYGADVNAQSEYLNNTPLYFAYVAKHPRMVNLLIDHGADATITDAYGLTPAQAAALWEDARDRQLERIEVESGRLDPRRLVRICWVGHRQGQTIKANSVLGFVAGPGARVVTAAHCLAPLRRIERDGYLVRPLVLSAFHGDLFEASVEFVDNVADAAVLKVSWPGHPGFELAEEAEIAASKHLEIVGHPPDSAGGERAECGQVAHRERLPVLRYSPKEGKRALIMGPRRFVGPGWSGAPILTPDAGRVAGVFGTREVWQYGSVTVLSNLEGCSADALRSHLGTRADIVEVEAPPDAEQAYGILVDLLNQFASVESEDHLAVRAEALAIRPRSAMVRILAMDLLDASDPGRDHLMEEDFRAALLLGPDSALVHGMRGLYFLRNDRPDDAVPHLEKALELAPASVFCRLWKARLLREDDPQAAETVLRESERNSASLLFELSRVLRQLERPGESLEALREACAFFEDDAEIPHLWMRHMADALRDSGSFEESDRWYQLMFTIHECTRCWLAYARLLNGLGDAREDDMLEAVRRAEGHGEELSGEDVKFIEQLRAGMEDS